ncbi:hypothetical protein HZA40_03765 [Candidatus Peregrinibacteria bacterium]|nr:hypothetical protein [Candidatus Peregrinibacteria bacterium]
MAHSSRKNDDGVIDLRNSADEPEFKINRVPEERHGSVGTQEHIPATPLTAGESAAMHPHDKVKVKFDKFVNLIATHAYQEIFDKHLDEDVIISTDLLADLANAHEEKDDGKKIPAFFLIGIVLGVIVTWIILKANA